MKALCKRYPGTGLLLEEAPRPHVGPSDVLIRVIKTAICGTDLHIYNWNDWAKKTIPIPMIVGHEFVGKVEMIGADVEAVSCGDLVSGEGHIVCGQCRNCRAGRRHLCAHPSGVGVNRQGAFAEFIAIPEANIWKHNSNVDIAVASFFDAYGNAAHTALSFDLLGEDILITGAGSIGCMAAAICRYAGARYVVVTDVNQQRLKMALTMGATMALNVQTTPIDHAIKKLGMKEGFDVGLEMSGASSAIQGMLQNMSHGGKIGLLGIPEKEIEIDWNLVIFKMLTIKGIYGREVYESWYKMTVMLEGGLDLTPVISEELNVDDYEKGFEAMNSGAAGKFILNWSSM